MPLQARPQEADLGHRRPQQHGKEANVFYASATGRDRHQDYRIQTANFKAMTEYLAETAVLDRPGDAQGPHLAGEKAVQQLARASESGLWVPEPLAFDRNILLMTVPRRG
jgi:RIO kinase 1